jgi:hypothetical protein
MADRGHRKSSGTQSAATASSGSDLLAAAAAQREPPRHVDAVQFQATYLQQQAEEPWAHLANSELMREVRLGLERILETKPEFPVAALATFLKTRLAERHETAMAKAITAGQQRQVMEARAATRQQAQQPSSNSSTQGSAKNVPSIAVQPPAPASPKAQKPLKALDVTLKICGLASQPVPPQFLPPPPPPPPPLQKDKHGHHPPAAIMSARETSIQISGPLSTQASTLSTLASPSKRRRKQKYFHVIRAVTRPFPRADCADPDAQKLIMGIQGLTDTRTATPVSQWARRSFTQCGHIPLFGLMKPTAAALRQLMAQLYTDGFSAIALVILVDDEVLFVDGHPHSATVRREVASRTGAAVSADTAVGWIIEAALDKYADQEVQSVQEAVTVAALKHQVKLQRHIELAFKPRSFISTAHMDRLSQFVLSPAQDEASVTREAVVVVSFVDDDALAQTLATCHCVLAAKWKANQVARLRRADAEAIVARDIEREHHEAEARVQDLRSRRRALKGRQAERDERRRKATAHMKIQVNHAEEKLAASASFTTGKSGEMAKLFDHMRTTNDDRAKRRDRNDALFSLMVAAERSRAVSIIKTLVQQFLRRRRARQRLDSKTAASLEASLTGVPPGGLQMSPERTRSPLLGATVGSSSNPPSPLGATRIAPTPQSAAGAGETTAPMSGKYDTANEEYVRDMNYAVVRLILDECRAAYPDTVMPDAPLPPPAPRQIGVWAWQLKRIKPLAPEDCSSEDESWTVDYSQRSYLPPLTTRHTHVNPRLCLVQALVDCHCDWRSDLFNARVLYGGVAAIQRRAARQLTVMARWLLLTIYGYLSASRHPSVARSEQPSCLLTFSEWVTARHPQLVSVIDHLSSVSALVSDGNGGATTEIAAQGPSNLQQYTLVRLPDAYVPLLNAQQQQPALTTPQANPQPTPLSQSLQISVGPLARVNSYVFPSGGKSPAPSDAPTPNARDMRAVGPTASFGAIEALPLKTSVGDAPPAWGPSSPAATVSADALWYRADPAAAHLAVDLSALQVSYAPPKSTRPAMIASTVAELLPDAANHFAARRLHPRVPVVVCSPASTAKSLHLLAVTLANAAQSAPAATPVVASGLPGAARPADQLAGSKHAGLLQVPAAAMAFAHGAHTNYQRSPAAALGPGSPVALQSTPTTLSARFLWWYVGQHPLVYIGGRPHAAVLRAAVDGSFANALIIRRAGPVKASSTSSMQQRPPRGVSGPLLGLGSRASASSASPVGADRSPGNAPPLQLSNVETVVSHSTFTAEGSGATTSPSLAHSQQPWGGDDKDMATEFPSWPETATTAASAANLRVQEGRWGGVAAAAGHTTRASSATAPRTEGCKWSVVEQRLCEHIEANITQTDGVLLRHVVAPEKVNDLLGAATSLDEVELKPDSVRVVKSKKPTVKPEETGQRDQQLDRRKTTRQQQPQRNDGEKPKFEASSLHPSPPALPHHGSGRTLTQRDSGYVSRASLAEGMSDKAPIPSKPTPKQILPTSSSDLVQPMNQVLQATLTLPLTHAAATGTSDGASGPAIPQSVVRIPYLPGLDEHIAAMSRVIETIPRGNGIGGLITEDSVTSDSFASQSFEAPPTMIFLVSTTQDLVLATAASLMWCAWCMPPSDGGAGVMLKEVVAKHGTDYTRPSSSQGDTAAAFVPAGGTAMPSLESESDDDNTKSPSSGRDDEAEDAHSEDIGSHAKPFFATVTLSSRAKVDSFTLVKREGEFDSDTSHMGDASYAPTSLQASAGGPRRSNPEDSTHVTPPLAPSLAAAFTPLACLNSLAGNTDLIDVDFAIDQAQHYVVATLLRCGLYSHIREPIDRLLSMEKAVLSVNAAHEPTLPPRDELRRIVVAASQAIERYALLVFAQCFATSDTWRGRADRNFVDFVNYYPSMINFLRHPHTLVSAEVPLPLFGDGLYRDPSDEFDTNIGRTAQSARGVKVARRTSLSLAHTARAVIANNVVGQGAGEKAIQWPLLRERVLPLELRELLNSDSRWQSKAVPYSLL